jgi:hypothetical protein
VTSGPRVEDDARHASTVPRSSPRGPDTDDRPHPPRAPATPPRGGKALVPKTLLPPPGSFATLPFLAERRLRAALRPQRR